VCQREGLAQDDSEFVPDLTGARGPVSSKTHLAKRPTACLRFPALRVAKQSPSFRSKRSKQLSRAAAHLLPACLPAGARLPNLATLLVAGGLTNSSARCCCFEAWCAVF